MTKTAELLACYRRIVFLMDENRRLQGSKMIWKSRFEETEEKLRQEKDKRREESRRHVDEICHLANQYGELALKHMDQNAALQEAFDACMELVGAVIEEDAMLDELMKDFDPTIADGIQVEDVVGEPATELKHGEPMVIIDTMPVGLTNPSMPLRCLSCAAEKDPDSAVCNDCFETDLDHNCTVFYELVDAWRKGERNFPRPGKNIKELYKS